MRELIRADATSGLEGKRLAHILAAYFQQRSVHISPKKGNSFRSKILYSSFRAGNNATDEFFSLDDFFYLLFLLVLLPYLTPIPQS